MDQKDVKRRDVWEFDEFSKAFDTAKKVIPLKKGELAHPGGHVIKAEALYYKNDANPYVAAGIEIPAKEQDQMNVNDKTTANRVDVYPQVKEDKEPTDKEIAAAVKVVTTVVATGELANSTNESVTETDLKHLAKEIYIRDVKIPSSQKRFIEDLGKLPVMDKRPDGHYCLYCHKFSESAQMELGDDSVVYHYDEGDSGSLPSDLKPSQIWIVNKHYDGCRGWS